MTLAHDRDIALDKVSAPVAGPKRHAVTYRAEIDGLRAFAVLPVLLFHAGIPPFSGGYVGVDVFFVISGYLITRICLADLSRGRFSLATFFGRRVRRIMPALFLVIAVSLPFAWWLMLPDALENFGQSIVATVLSANNILLLLTTGYWDLAAEFKPLLHTWSLAVEEQYYILFPALLMALHAFARRALVPVIVGIGLASFALCLVWAGAYPTANFYLLPTRAFELLAGSLCAAVGLPRESRASGPLAALGLAMLAASTMALTGDTPFPSAWTLLPVGGTVLVVLFAPGTATARFLSFAPFVGIGLISYSLYLWHQPVFAFARLVSVEEPGPPVFVGLIAVSFALSFLSWRFVETPARDRTRLPGRVFFPMMALVAIALIAIGAALHLTRGAPSRVDMVTNGEDSHILYNERIRRFTADAFPQNGQENVLVIGNSFARDAANMGLEAGYLANRNLVYRADAGACLAQMGEIVRALVAQADEVWLPSGNLPDRCIESDAALAASLGFDLVVFGPKAFGHNVNAYMHTPHEARADTRARLAPEMIAQNVRMRAATPEGHYVDFLATLGESDGIRMFDDAGMLLSQDGVHFTKAGAVFAGKAVFGDPPRRPGIPDEG